MRRIDLVELRRLTSILIMSVLLAVAWLQPARAQEWHPAEPSPDEMDWVQLVSGEWLGGNMDLFRDLKMEFDSDELDDLVLEWEDIAAFRVAREMTFVFTGGRTATGPATMRDGAILISTTQGDREFDRRDLLSIIEGRPKEINFWSAKASIGATVKTGNTEQTDTSSRLKVTREATISRFNLEYLGSYSEVSKEGIADNHRATTLLDLFLSRKLFITPVSYEYYSDKFQNIDYRSTLGAGLGYFIFRQSNVDWSVGIGGAYQATDFLSVEEGAEADEKTGSLITSTELEWDITGGIEMELQYRSMLGVPDLETSTHHTAAFFSFDFYKDVFELTFSVVWDRVDNPKAFEDGTVPETDDIEMTFGFGVDL